MAQATVTVREAADRPTIAALGGYTRTNHVTPFIVPSAIGLPRVLYPDVPNNYHSRLDLQWPIYTGGRTDALERAARAEAAAAGADVSVAQADLRLEVARAFWAVVTARATVDVLEQGVKRSQAHVADVRAAIRRRARAAERDRLRRGAGVAGADARHRGAETSATLPPPISPGWSACTPGQSLEPVATLDAPSPARRRHRPARRRRP